MITAVTTGPESEPISLDEVKSSLRITDNASDGTLLNLIIVARQNVEAFLRRSLMPQEITGYLDQLDGDVIDLPFPPIRSVTSLSYTDSDGVWQPVSDDVFTLDAPGMRILRAYGKSWPRSRRGKSTVKIVYEAGYINAESVPAVIKNAILCMVSHLYDGDEKSMKAAESLLWPYRDLR